MQNKMKRIRNKIIHIKKIETKKRNINRNKFKNSKINKIINIKYVKIKI